MTSLPKIDLEKSIFYGSVRFIVNTDTMMGRIDDDGMYLDKPFKVIGVDLI